MRVRGGQGGSSRVARAGARARVFSLFGPVERGDVQGLPAELVALVHVDGRHGPRRRAVQHREQVRLRVEPANNQNIARKEKRRREKT